MDALFMCSPVILVHRSFELGALSRMVFLYLWPDWPAAHHSSYSDEICKSRARQWRCLLMVTGSGFAPVRL